MVVFLCNALINEHYTILNNITKLSISSVSHLVESDSLQPHRLKPARVLHPWDSPGKKPGVGCHSLLQRIFLTQGSNPGLPYCRQILYHLSHRTVCTTDTQPEPAARHGELCSMHVAVWTGGAGGEWTRVYVWLSGCALHLHLP